MVRTFLQHVCGGYIIIQNRSQYDKIRWYAKYLIGKVKLEATNINQQ